MHSFRKVDTKRHFPRLDFRIVNCVNAMCILEVDEDQHYWYNLSCEMSKHSRGQGCVKPMSISALGLASVAIPASWLSYHNSYFAKR